ncbi:L-histidine N(alpha)-methyltransferase [Anabaena subtropica]|uniref:L-histidine N(Alpha)-methyltransferase n=1 Tax=Anabaena subtropica FACHB-260 TaxID=2692884 RepID=A0ABR8CJR3_9NOST|nr:L-histidine N(alpha)-methyltransferase [Anabaena subtropica]MBD2342778.1 L-histidine N(alpha)-methyltransferase [Anabaena subtropica FACHB-260]
MKFLSHTPIIHISKPSADFYSVFSQAEILEIVQTLEVQREIPLKYSYKGRGAKIWDNFYLKYIIPTWYRKSNIEIDLLEANFEYINGNYQKCEKINIIDVGAGNSYPVKSYIDRLNKINKINKYIALDISEDLLKVSSKNIKKWFPLIDCANYRIDIENTCVPKNILENQHKKIANIFLHLGVTIANHQNRTQVFKNFRDSMNENDLLVFTNEIGSSSQWDGIARGGCKHHADQVYRWITNNIGIRREDCELVRKYDLATDSIVANMKFRQNYTINFSYLGIDKNIEISAGEEITIWRHHKFEITALIQEIEEAGLKLVHYSTNKYSSHLMMICEIENNS